MNFKPSNPMTELTAQLYEMNKTLTRAEKAYLLKEAERKHFESSLVLKASGRSMAERKTLAEASVEWLEFHQALANLEALYHFQKMKMEIMRSDWQSWYLTHKLDADLIKKEQP